MSPLCTIPITSPKGLIPYYVTMLKKTGFVERRVNGLVNAKDYPTMFKKTGFVEKRGNRLVNPFSNRISFKIGLKPSIPPVYYYYQQLTTIVTW